MNNGWVLWNKETENILQIGSEAYIRETAKNLNRIYQTDAYEAHKFVPKNRR